MSDMNLQVNQDTDTQTLLHNLRLLRSFEGSDKVFYSAYCQHVMLLLKSPCALILGLESEQLQIRFAEFQDTDEVQSRDYVALAQALLARARKHGFAYDKITAKTASSLPVMGVLFKLFASSLDNSAEQFMFLLLTHEDKRQFNELLLRFSLIADVGTQRHKSSLPAVAEAYEQQAPDDILKHIIELVSLINEQKRFWLACSVLVNELSNRFECDKVSLGWKQGDYIIPKAISHIESFAKNTPAVHALENVYEEAYEQDAEIYVPEDSQRLISHTHQKYLAQYNLSGLLSLPVRYQSEVVAVVTFEKVNAQFTQQQLHGLRLLLNKVSVPLARLHDSDRNVLVKTGARLKHYASWWLGVEHTLTKLIAIVIFLGLAYIFLGSWQYKIEATMQLATNEVAYVSAPLEAVIEEVYVNSGDQVKKGDLLLSFNQEELLLSEVEAIAEISKFQSESEKFRASKKLADMEIALARRKQAEARLQRTQYYLQQINVTAPMSGSVIEGDKEKLRGAPVNKGEIIFQISQSTQIFARLKVLQQDIDLVKPGHEGEFVLLSNPDKKYTFVVEKIIPVAQVDNVDGNIFSVEGRITSPADSWWYPGISGVAKLDIGEKKIYWVMTHRLVDFLRVYFWV